ncbi:hypothetical protein Golax_021244 [Gossypium laxum]|uniref:Uncharacterized protein n=1 Tax=Gossypium laxum TaxID=34288 RepID=A0A7J9AKQ5_9ROSI|nr:hypothetical protein [Gossypium laxum]
MIQELILSSSCDEREDQRKLKISYISQGAQRRVKNNEVKRVDSVSTIETDSIEREFNAGVEKKQETLKASNSLKVMQPFRGKLLAVNMKAKFVKVVAENLVLVVLDLHLILMSSTINADLFSKLLPRAYVRRGMHESQFTYKIGYFTSNPSTSSYSVSHIKAPSGNKGNHQFPPLSTSEYNLRLTLETDMSDGKKLIVVIYNSLGWKREDAICLTVVNEAVTVHDQEGRKFETQLVPIDAYVDLSYHARAYFAVGSASKDIHPAQPQFTPFHKSTDSLSYSGPVHQLVPNVTSPTSQSSLVSITMVLSLKYGFFCAATSLSSDISEGDIDKPVGNDPFELQLDSSSQQKSRIWKCKPLERIVMKHATSKGVTLEAMFGYGIEIKEEQDDMAHVGSAKLLVMKKRLQSADIEIYAEANSSAPQTNLMIDDLGIRDGLKGGNGNEITDTNSVTAELSVGDAFVACFQSRQQFLLWVPGSIIVFALTLYGLKFFQPRVTDGLGIPIDERMFFVIQS